MINTLWRSLALAACMAVAFAQASNAPAIARAAAIELAQGRLDEFYARLDAEMSAAVPQPALKDLIQSLLLTTAGPFEKVESNPTCQAVKAVQVCEVPLLFQMAHVRLRLLVNADGRIAGLFNLGRTPR